MIIPFSKIANKEINFELVRNNDLVFSGILKRQDPFLVKCQGTIKGEIKYICDRCGDEFMLPIDQDVELNLCDGVYKDRENELSDTVEFFDCQKGWSDSKISKYFNIIDRTGHFYAARLDNADIIKEGLTKYVDAH